MERVLFSHTFSFFLVLLFLNIHGYFDTAVVVSATCKLNSTIQNKQQAMIDEVINEPVVTTLDAPPFVSLMYQDPNIETLQLQRAEINYYYLGKNSSLLITVAEKRRKRVFDGRGSMFNSLRANLIIWREFPGQKFITITDLVLENRAHTIRRIVQVPNNKDVDSLLFLVSDEDFTYYYLSYTKDAGKTFERFHIHQSLPQSCLLLLRSFPELTVSPSSIEHLVVEKVCLTTDGGRNWVRITDREFFPSSESENHKTVWVNSSMILTSTLSNFSKYSNMKGVVSLHRCDVSGEKPKCRMLFSHIKNFAVEGNAIVASVYHESDQLANRSIFATTDLGDVWNRAQIPVLQQHDRPFVFMKSETLSFLMLLDEQEECYDMYVSDSVHVAYSLSMKCAYQLQAGDVYPRKVNIRQLCDLPNVLAVNKLDYFKNETHMYVTRNNGGSWNKAELKKSDCSDECEFMLYNNYAYDYSFFSSIIDKTDQIFHLVHSQLTSTFVPGFALLRISEKLGQLRTTESVVTVDGCQSFFKVPGTANQKDFTFLSSGDVLVNYGSSDSFHLSFDRGHCWYNYTLHSSLTLSDNNRRVIVATNSLDHQHDTLERIVISVFQPFAYSYEKTVAIESYIFDVGAMAKEVPTCEEDNTHVESEDDCVLGNKYHYKRPKQGSQTCKLHQSELKRDSSVCECTYEDFECDFGFRARSTRDSNNANDGTLICDIMTEEELDQVSICYHQLYGKHEKYFNTTGYRKVVGTKCKEGTVDRQINSLQPVSFKILCEADDEILKEIMQSQISSRPKEKNGFSFGKLLLAILVLTLVGCVIGLVIYLVTVKNIKPSFDLSFIQTFRSTSGASFKFTTFDDEA